MQGIPYHPVHATECECVHIPVCPARIPLTASVHTVKAMQ